MATAASAKIRRFTILTRSLLTPRKQHDMTSRLLSSTRLQLTGDAMARNAMAKRTRSSLAASSSRAFSAAAASAPPTFAGLGSGVISPHYDLLGKRASVPEFLATPKTANVLGAPMS